MITYPLPQKSKLPRTTIKIDAGTAQLADDAIAAHFKTTGIEMTRTQFINSATKAHAQAVLGNV